MQEQSTRLSAQLVDESNTIKIKHLTQIANLTKLNEQLKSRLDEYFYCLSLPMDLTFDDFVEVRSKSDTFNVQKVQETVI